MSASEEHFATVAPMTAHLANAGTNSALMDSMDTALKVARKEAEQKSQTEKAKGQKEENGDSDAAKEEDENEEDESEEEASSSSKSRLAGKKGGKKGAAGKPLSKKQQKKLDREALERKAAATAGNTDESYKDLLAIYTSHRSQQLPHH